MKTCTFSCFHVQNSCFHVFSAYFSPHDIKRVCCISCCYSFRHLDILVKLCKVCHVIRTKTPLSLSPSLSPSLPLSLSLSLQTYLSEDEFVKVFGITQQEFRSLPKWKQSNAKKKVDLF